MRESLDIISADELERFAKIGLDRSQWYERATAEIIGICRLERGDVVQFAKLIAVLSPRVSIRRNIRMALEYREHGVHFANTVNTIRTSVVTLEKTGEILGKKTRPFADALLGDREAIVLDTWMSKVMLPGEFKTDSSSFRRVATRRGAETVIRTVATRLGLCPRDCQAAIWSGVFRTFGQQPQWFPIREEYNRWIAYDRNFPLQGAVEDEPSQPEESF